MTTAGPSTAGSTPILAHFDDEAVGAVTGRMLDHTLVGAMRPAATVA